MAWDSVAQIVARSEQGPEGVNREDLSDQITMVSPWELPLMGRIGSNAATGIDHGFPLDRLKPPAAGRTGTSGGSYGTPSMQSPKRSTNWCQSVRDAADVSTIQQASDKAGRSNDLAYQVWKTMKFVLTCVETDYMGWQAKQADAGSGALLGGLGSYIWHPTEATIDGGATGTEVDYSTTPGWADGTQARSAGTTRALTETIFDGVIESVWQAGGNPNSVYTTMPIKNGIGKVFSGVATKYQNLDDRQLQAGVDIYDSVAGRLEIVPCRHIPAETLYVIEDALLARSDLIPLYSRPLGVTKAADEEGIEIVTTLEVKNGEGLGAIYDITKPV